MSLLIGIPFKQQIAPTETRQGTIFSIVNYLAPDWFRQAGKRQMGRKGGTNFRMMHFKSGIKNRKDYIP